TLRRMPHRRHRFASVVCHGSRVRSRRAVRLTATPLAVSVVSVQHLGGAVAPVRMLLTLVQLLVATVGMFACRRVGPIEPPPPPPPGTHVGWYVTATGTSGGDGTNAQPWDLQTALSGGNGKVQVGDTIWLRQGTYHGTFYSGLSGDRKSTRLNSSHVAISYA